MKQIIQPLSTISAILGTQSGVPDKVKDSVFLIKQPISDGWLFYSVFTKELLFLTKQEYDCYSENSSLYEKWFLVPEHLDEATLRDQLHAIVGATPSALSPNTFTILPTTDCNAHCFYCFERQRSHIAMSTDTAEKVADYIIHNGEPNQSLCLRWFGGEPLMNQEAMDLICSRLTDNSIAFSSRIVTNGYLLTNDVVDKALSLWNLDKVQITIDGTKEVYNRVKAIDSSDDAYTRVINNISYLLSKNVQVRIRLNLDTYNARDMITLVSNLINQFQSCPTLKIYTELLFEKAGDKERMRSHADRSQLYQTSETINSMLASAGLGLNASLPRTYKHYQCMADSGKAVVIAPDGHLGLCEHFTDSEFFGSVLSDETNQDMIRSWQEHMRLPECASCPLSPDCIRVKKCVENAICPEERRSYRINELKKCMEKEYENYLKQKEREVTSEN